MPTYTAQPSPLKVVDTASLNNRESIKAEFAKRLYSAIMEKGWTQSELARASGLNRDAVSTYVRGKSMPSPQALEAMASALGFKPEQILPNYFEAGQSKVQPTMELRDVPNDAGYMWLRMDVRLPKKVAMELFIKAQEHV